MFYTLQCQQYITCTCTGIYWSKWPWSRTIYSTSWCLHLQEQDRLNSRLRMNILMKTIHCVSTGKCCSQPSGQRRTESIGQINGRVGSSETRKHGQRFPSQPLLYRRGRRVSPHICPSTVSVFGWYSIKYNFKFSLCTDIVTPLSQRGINIKTRWACVRSH